jgi:hypothetical protein
LKTRLHGAGSIDSFLDLSLTACPLTGHTKKVKFPTSAAIASREVNFSFSATLCTPQTGISESFSMKQIVGIRKILVQPDTLEQDGTDSLITVAVRLAPKE